MQGVHAFDPKAKTAIDLESFVAADHFLRRVDRVLDLSFVRELTAPGSAVQGRPSIDPEVYFRMQLVAYLFGITSERQLCEEVYYNLAYRWFCRLSLEDEVPDHSSLTRIRDRYGEEIFESVFRRIVEQCKQKGLVQGVSSDDRCDLDRCRRLAELAGAQRSGRSAEGGGHSTAATRDEGLVSGTACDQSNAPQPHGSGRHAGPEARNASATQVQGSPNHRR